SAAPVAEPRLQPLHLCFLLEQAQLEPRHALLEEGVPGDGRPRAGRVADGPWGCRAGTRGAATTRGGQEEGCHLKGGAAHEQVTCRRAKGPGRPGAAST